MSISQSYVSERDRADQAAIAFMHSGDPVHLEAGLADVSPMYGEPEQQTPYGTGRKWAIYAGGALALVGSFMAINSRLSNDRAFQYGKTQTSVTTTEVKPAHTDDCRNVNALAGDSVWTIVREAHPTGDIRDEVDRIVETELHGVSTDLQSGDRIKVC